MSFEEILLPLHLLTLFGVIGIMLIADYSASRWFRGVEPTLRGAHLRRLHHLMWAGLSLMLMTGVLMFWPVREYLLYQPAFWIKMSFVAVLIINGVFVGRLMHVATVQTFASLTKNEKILLFVSGGASFVGWVGAGVSALFLGL